MDSECDANYATLLNSFLGILLMVAVLSFQHIASNIVDHDVRPKEILQSSFDLLGELVKFNIEAFKAFAKVLNTPARVSHFT